MKTAGWSAVLLLLLLFGLAASLTSAQYIASKGEWCGLQGPQRVGLAAALTEQRVKAWGRVWAASGHCALHMSVEW